MAFHGISDLTGTNDSRDTVTKILSMNKRFLILKYLQLTVV